MGRRFDPTLLALAAIVAGAATARFTTIAEQSYWLDEGRTVHFVNESFAGMLDGVVDPGEAEPPLYFIVVWAWGRLFGDGELALRSLSAVAGVATVVVAYLAARTLVNRVAGLVAAALVAASPVMVWYSQEARAYALFLLFAALSFWLFAEGLRSGRGRVLGAWAGASALALATHWMALFVLPVQALWLLLRLRTRPAFLAVCALAVAGLALAPVALYQRRHGAVGWIDALPMKMRLDEAMGWFTVGIPDRSIWVELLVVLAFACVAVLVVLRARPRVRAGAVVALGVAAAAGGLPLLAALAGSDYVLHRNLLAAYVPLTVVVAAGATVARYGTMVVVGAVALCALMVRNDVQTATTASLQRDDWRSVAEALGPPRDDRVVVVAPGWQSHALALYGPPLEPLRSKQPAREVVIVVYRNPGWNQDAPPQPPPGRAFVRAGSRVVQRMTLTWFRAEHPSPVDPHALNTPGPNGSLSYALRAH